MPREGDLPTEGGLPTEGFGQTPPPTRKASGTHLTGMLSCFHILKCSGKVKYLAKNVLYTIILFILVRRSDLH